MYSTKGKNKIFAKGFLVHVKYLSAYLFGQVFLSPGLGKSFHVQISFKTFYFTA